MITELLPSKTKQGNNDNVYTYRCKAHIDCPMLVRRKKLHSVADRKGVFLVEVSGEHSGEAAKFEKPVCIHDLNPCKSVVHVTLL